MSSLNLPVCIICRAQFDSDQRIPYTQPCNHTICNQCIVHQTITNCPIDQVAIVTNRSINHALLYFLFGTSIFQSCADTGDCSIESAIDSYLIDLTKLLRDSFIGQSSNLSAQLSRRLFHLIESSPHHPEGRAEFVRRLRSVFNRLLLELIQAHYNTKQREQDFVRLVQSKGCSIIPNLTDEVIISLLKLFNAAGNHNDASYQRWVLVKYIMNELGTNDTKLRRQVEKTIQTLYRCSCFQIIRAKGASSFLKLKEDFYSVEELRQKHDAEMMKMAQSANIRLTAQSWAHLLRGCSDSNVISKMQSLLDRYQSPVQVEELEAAIKETKDKHKIGTHLNKLCDVKHILDNVSIKEMGGSDYKSICVVLEKLTSIKHLFTTRQCRSTVHKL